MWSKPITAPKIDVLRKPVLVCSTCGKSTNYVSVLKSPTLVDEERKTWQRCIKPDTSKTIRRGKKAQNRTMYSKVIYYAPALIECYEKKHKIEVRFGAVPKSLISTFNYRKVK